MGLIAVPTIAGASLTTAGGDLIINKPTGVASGDWMICFIICSANTVITAPAGWTTDGTAAGIRTYRKQAGGSEPSTYTFTRASQLNNIVGLIARVTGADATNPVDTLAQQAGGSGTTVVLPSITVTTGFTLLQIGLVIANTSFTPPSGPTELFDQTFATNNSTGFVGIENVGAGSTGTRTWTAANSGVRSGVMYAFIPAVATVSTDLVGDGVMSRQFAVTESAQNLVGDGVVTRQFGESTSRDLTGSGVLTRDTTAVGLPRDVTGDGTVTRGVLAVTESKDVTGDGVVATAKATTAAKTTDLVGDGTVTRQVDVTESKDLTGEGVLDSAKAVAASKTVDLVGEGVLSKSVDVGLSRDLTGDGDLDYIRSVGIVKTFDLVGDGILTEEHATGVSKIFDLTGEGVITGSADIPFPIIPACPPDWSPNDGLKAIAGNVFFHEPPNEGDPVPGATVTLVRDSDGFIAGTTTTDGAGHYSFPRDTNDPYTYHVEVTWTDGGSPQQGLSEGGCVPV